MGFGNDGYRNYAAAAAAGWRAGNFIREAYKNYSSSNYSNSTNRQMSISNSALTSRHRKLRPKVGAAGDQRVSRRKLQKMMEQYINSSFSSVTINFETETALSHVLSYWPSTSCVLPMYCWDLTTLPVSVNTSSGILPLGYAASQPMYVLQKNAGGLYSWSLNASTSAQGPMPSTTSASGYGIDSSKYTWHVDKWSDLPVPNRAYVHAYTEAEFIFQGATNRDDHINVMLVEFGDCDVGPLRSWSAYNPTTGVFTNQTSPDVSDSLHQAQAQNFWDRFWAKKLNNPIYSANIASDQARHMKVLFHDRIHIPAETSVNIDQRGHSVSRKYYFPVHQPVSMVNSTYVSAYDEANKVGVTEAAATNVVSSCDTLLKNDIFNTDYKSNKFLVVYLDNPYPNNISPAYCPSFDMVIKSKHILGN